MEVIVPLVRLIYHDVRQLKRQVLTRFELPRYVTICVVTPYGLCFTSLCEQRPLVPQFSSKCLYLWGELR